MSAPWPVNRGAFRSTGVSDTSLGKVKKRNCFSVDNLQMLPMVSRSI